MLYLKLFTLCFWAVVKALDINNPTTLTGDQTFNEILNVNPDASLTLEGGSSYIFLNKTTIFNPGSLDATFNSQAYLSTFQMAGPFEVSNGCLLTITNPNTAQNIEISPIVFENSGTMIISLAHTASDEGSTVKISSQYITNSGTLVYEKYDGNVEADPLQNGNIFTVSSFNTIQNSGTISFGGAAKYYLYGPISGPGSIEIHQGTLIIDSNHFQGNTCKLINTLTTIAAFINTNNPYPIKVEGLSDMSSIDTAGAGVDFTYDNLTGILTVTTSLGVNRYDIGCGYISSLLTGSSSSVNYNGNIISTYSVTYGLEAPADTNCQDIIPTSALTSSSVPPSSSIDPATSSIPTSSDTATSPIPTSTLTSSSIPPSSSIDPATSSIPTSSDTATSPIPTSTLTSSSIPPSSSIDPATSSIPPSSSIDPATSSIPTSSDTATSPIPTSTLTSSSIPPSSSIDPATSSIPPSSSIDPATSSIPPSSSIDPATATSIDPATPSIPTILSTWSLRRSSDIPASYLAPTSSSSILQPESEPYVTDRPEHVTPVPGTISDHITDSAPTFTSNGVTLTTSPREGADSDNNNNYSDHNNDNKNGADEDNNGNGGYESVSESDSNDPSKNDDYDSRTNEANSQTRINSDQYVALSRSSPKSNPETIDSTGISNFHSHSLAAQAVSATNSANVTTTLFGTDTVENTVLVTYTGSGLKVHHHLSRTLLTTIVAISLLTT
ncbi:Hyphally regulated cell wall protein N-terminal [Nakaseomyces bracarensis]|uniref:Hyphally regulated cell wall protein N-terminal n=1 Tax=Nakaseomyces bracarensis TaxID=273131 RepID=A0ABR4NW37_9SACH